MNSKEYDVKRVIYTRNLVRQILYMDATKDNPELKERELKMTLDDDNGAVLDFYAKKQSRGAPIVEVAKKDEE